MAGIKFDLDAFLRPHKEFDDAQRMRGWIVHVFAMSEYFLTDFISKSMKFGIFLSKWSVVPGDFRGRISRVRSMIEICEEINHPRLIIILDNLESGYENRNILAHGLCSALPSEAKITKYEFRKWERIPNEMPTEVIKEFTTQDLYEIANDFGKIALEFTGVLRDIYHKHGWTGESVFRDR